MFAMGGEAEGGWRCSFLGDRGAQWGPWALWGREQWDPSSAWVVPWLVVPHSGLTHPVRPLQDVWGLLMQNPGSGSLGWEPCPVGSGPQCRRSLWERGGPSVFGPWGQSEGRPSEAWSRPGLPRQLPVHPPPACCPIAWQLVAGGAWGPASPSELWVSLSLKVQGSGMHSPSVVLSRRPSGAFLLRDSDFPDRDPLPGKGPLLMDGGKCVSPGSSFDESPIYHK